MNDAYDRNRTDSLMSAAGSSYCPLCGSPPDELVIQRGPIVVTSEPIEVFWQNKRVPLSQTEATVFRMIFVRGRASYQALDDAIIAIGCNPTGRSALLSRLRQKFVALGGSDPIALGKHGVTLADHGDRRETIIGLTMAPDMIGNSYRG